MLSTASPLAACAGVAASVAACSTGGRAFASVQFHTTSSWPASSRRIAIRLRIAARPTNPSTTMRRIMPAATPPTAAKP
jgi:hypothetical protein